MDFENKWFGKETLSKSDLIVLPGGFSYEIIYVLEQ